MVGLNSLAVTPARSWESSVTVALTWTGWALLPVQYCVGLIGATVTTGPVVSAACAGARGRARPAVSPSAKVALTMRRTPERDVADMLFSCRFHQWLDVFTVGVWADAGPVMVPGLPCVQEN